MFIQLKLINYNDNKGSFIINLSACNGTQLWNLYAHNYILSIFGNLPIFKNKKYFFHVLIGSNMVNA